MRWGVVDRRREVRGEVREKRGGERASNASYD